MNKIRGKVSRKLLAVVVLAAVGAVSVLATPLAYADCGGLETAIINCDAGANPTMEILKLVLKVLTGLVGIAAVGALIFAGITYSSASGDQSRVQKAKTMIQNTVIGIVVYGTMFLIGNWLIPGGVFGADVTYSGNGVNGSAATGSVDEDDGSSGGGEDGDDDSENVAVSGACYWKEFETAPTSTCPVYIQAWPAATTR